METGKPEIASLEEFFGGNMRPAVAVETFLHSDRLFPVREIPNGGAVRAFPASPAPLPDIRFQSCGKICDLNDYLAVNRVAGLLILKDGAVVLENYELGLKPEGCWSSCSIAKSIASTLVGAAVRDGAIAGLDDPVTHYIPELSGSAYEGVTIRHLLTMSSGVAWDETYTDPNSHRRHLLEAVLTRGAGSIIDYMKSLPRAAEPGTVCTYNTGDSYLVGAALERAVGQNAATYLSQKIWSRLGMRRSADWWLEAPGGMALVGSGISATLSDFGRFAQFVLDEGRIDGEPVVPEGWFAEAGAPLMPASQGYDYGYGYMWWTPGPAWPDSHGVFMAFGIYGQTVYINSAQRLAIVTLCARSKPSQAARVELDDDAFFAAVAAALR